MYNKTMGKNMGAFRRGFTIIEVMLFLALSGILLVGILGGLGGNIARQRYNDAVQDVVSIMKDQYSFVSDTEVAARSSADNSNCYALITDDVTNGAAWRGKSDAYRGRTNCVVYGAVISLNEHYIETTELIGRDYRSEVRRLEDTSTPVSDNLTDIQILKDVVHANNVFLHCNVDASGNRSGCFVRSGDKSRIQHVKWGVRLLDEEGNPLKKTMIIFRSPRDGSIRTYVMNDSISGNVLNKGPRDPINYNDDVDSQNGGIGIEDNEGASLTQIGVNRFLSNFSSQELNICVDSGDGQTYNDARRMIKIQKAGMSQSAVELINMDIAKDNETGEEGRVLECARK